MTSQSSASAGRSRLRTSALLVPPVAALGLWLTTLKHREWNEPFFVASAYYALFVLLAAYAGVQLSLRRTAARAWLAENWPGVVMTAAVAGTVLYAVKPSLRVLADEANLVGVSKSLFFHRTANFTVAGKWYYENYWDISQVTDRRPALFPFLVSLVHLVKGYRIENAFDLNALVFVAFVWSTYSLGKRLAGQTFALSAALLVAVNPNTLIAVRSAGFDFLSTFFLLLIVKSFDEFLRERTPARLAIYALTLCLVAHIRYEGWALLLAGAAVPLVLRKLKRELLLGFEWLYACMPLLLLPRYWQAVAKAADAEQPLSASLFSIKNFGRNLLEYLSIVRQPLETGGPHAPLLIVLGLAGTLLIGGLLVKRLRARQFDASFEFAVLALAVLGLETLITFSYDWGRPLHAASCRLFIWLDTFMGFAGAWCVTLLARRWPMHVAWLGRRSAAPAAVLASAVLFAAHAPAAVEARFTNTLILTREAAQTWRFFDALGDKQILILCDRPGLFTIKDYGANHISIAETDRGALYELSRKLYHDIYLVQEVDLETKKPLAGFDVWSDVPMDPVWEFQNTDTEFIRISRVRKAALAK